MMNDEEIQIIEIKHSVHFSPSIYDIIYVERSHNDKANALLSKLHNDEYHPCRSKCLSRLSLEWRKLKGRFTPYDKKDPLGGYRFVYLPLFARDLAAKKKIVKYANPNSKKTDFDFNNLYNIIFDYTDDAGLLESGFIHFINCRDYNNYFFSYTPFSQFDIDNPRNTIVQILEREDAWKKVHFKPISRGSDIRFSIKYDPDEECADEKFNSHIMVLIKEVSERVEKLEQYGLSRAVLFKMLGDDVKLSRMKIDSRNRIFLVDYDNVEIKMTPLVKAVYFLFLNHPEGIMFKLLPNYKKELQQIYEHLTSRSDMLSILGSIENICNPMDNSINEKCTRIKEAFVVKFDNEIAKNYYVRGEKGEPKKITLDRNLVEREG